MQTRQGEGVGTCMYTFNNAINACPRFGSKNKRVTFSNVLLSAVGLGESKKGGKSLALAITIVKAIQWTDCKANTSFSAIHNAYSLIAGSIRWFYEAMHSSEMKIKRARSCPTKKPQIVAQTKGSWNHSGVMISLFKSSKMGFHFLFQELHGTKP